MAKTDFLGDKIRRISEIPNSGKKKVGARILVSVIHFYNAANKAHETEENGWYAAGHFQNPKHTFRQQVAVVDGDDQDRQQAKEEG